MDGEVWYTDNDGDGFASDNAQAKILCVQPTDAAQILGDCDDNNIDASTGQEICDGIDNDCDLLIDATDMVLLNSQPTTSMEMVTVMALVNHFDCEIPPNGTLSNNDCDDENPHHRSRGGL